MAPNFSFETAPVKMISFTLLYCVLICMCTATVEYNCSEGTVHLHNRQAKITANDNKDAQSKKLCIVCHAGQERTWLRLWINPRITIEGTTNKMAPEDLTIYYGRNVSDTKQQMSSSVLFSYNSLLLLKEEHSFAPFNLSCIGLSSSKKYTVFFRVKNPELWYLAYIAIGVTVFFFAPTWSRNVAFHYSTGVTVGVLASVIVVMFILTRLMPQRLKTVSYVVMAVSSSASLFMFQLVKTYLQEIVQDHWQFALGYVVVSALLSFALIYRFGPLTDGRTLNLVCWVMQAFGLILIYQGTQIPEASAAIIILVLTVYFCPKAMPQWLKRLRYRLFPPRTRLLTEEEFNREGERETRRALAELREFCHSPDCNAWRVVSRLKSPQRFAGFVDGAPDVSDNEADQHEDFIHNHPLFLLRNPDASNILDGDGDGDSDAEFSLRRQSNHVNNSHDHFDSDSEIEDTAYEGVRYRR